jgi:hypothetical protein
MYQQLYDEFLKTYKKTETLPSEVGEVLARIAGEFPNFNTKMINAEYEFSLVHKKIVEDTDELTGKAISSAKAEVVAAATPECLAYKAAKGDVTNIEMLIGALKFMQKSLEVEYVNSSL